MQFFEITATKYGLALGMEPPTPITRALLDLFISASSSSASLLEGIVVLWGIEHVCICSSPPTRNINIRQCYRSAWQYASSFSTSLSHPSNDSHIVALHQALIPNWTSPAFSKFVDATRALVDELANITTTRDGKEEMQRCEEIFRQICWLEQRFWPDVDGMGEQNDSDRMSSAGLDTISAGISNMNSNVGPSMSGMNNMGGSMNGPMSSGGMNGPGVNGGDDGSKADEQNVFGQLSRGSVDGLGQGS